MGLVRLLRQLIEGAPDGSWPAPLGPLADCLDQGPCDLREPAAQSSLAGMEGFGEKGHRVVISGDLLRRLLIALERELAGSATTLGFRRIIVDGPLALNDLVFDRSLLFEDCEFRGPIEARMLACRTLTIENSKLAASLDGRVMSLRGNLFLRRSEVAGPVIIRDTSVTGVIDCSDSAFNFSPPARGGAADLGMAPEQHFDEAFGASRVLARALFWREIRLGGSGDVTFRDADVTSLRDDMAENKLCSWPIEGRLNLRGFTYARKNAAPLDIHLQWLELDAANFETNGRVLVACLEAANAIDDAAKLRIEIRRHANRSEGEPFRRCARAIYLWLQSLAFHPGWVLVWLAVLYGGSVLAAYLLQRSDLIVPVDGSIITNKCFLAATRACAADGWAAVAGHPYALPRALPPFSSWSYALDLIFPYRPGAYTILWGGTNTGISLLLLGLRLIGLAFQASLLWSLFGNRDAG